LLISTVVMFQAQNRETINSTWKAAVSFKIIMTTSVTRPCFTTQHQTCKTKITLCKTKTKTDFLVSDRSCPKTDGLRPHHWREAVAFWVRLEKWPLKQLMCVCACVFACTFFKRVSHMAACCTNEWCGLLVLASFFFRTPSIYSFWCEKLTV